MEGTRTVDVATLLNTIAQQLVQNEGHLNNVDGAGTHGQRMAAAFNSAANAASKVDSEDAGVQLFAAAQAMRKHGTGKATSFYADGLEEAAQQFKGQRGISTENVLPFLRAFLGGVERNNPAKPGQGTMIDALSPAVTALEEAQQRGQSTEEGLLQTLGAAITGTQRTAADRGRVDPGAASATNVIGGIIVALAPTLLNMFLNRGRGSGADMNQGYGYGQQPGGLGGGLGGLLGGLLGGGGGSGGSQGGYGYGDPYGRGGQAQQPDSGMGGLGDLLGGLLGGGGMGGTPRGGSGGGGQMDWIGGLLGGLMGGGGAGGRSGLGGRGEESYPSPGGLGDLLGGLLGGGGGEDDTPRSRGRGGLEGRLGLDDEGRGGSQSGSW